MVGYVGIIEKCTSYRETLKKRSTGMRGQTLEA